MQEFAQGRSGPLSNRTPALNADKTGDLRLLRELVEAIERPWLLVVNQAVDEKLVIVPVDIRRILLAIIGIEREGTRYRAFRIGRRKPVRIEQPGLYAIVETRHDAKRILRRRPIDDVAPGQEGKRPAACPGPQEVAERRHRQ